MINTGILSDLFRHMEWADARVWTTVLGSEGAQTDQRLRDCLYHLHVVQRAFLRIWRGESLETPFPTFDDAPSLMQWARGYYSEAMACIESLSAQQLSEDIPLAWASLVEQRLGRAPESTTIGETVLQVAMHSMYHRGQVNARLREAGGEPPLVDYIAWVWLGRPGAEWPRIP